MWRLHCTCWTLWKVFLDYFDDGLQSDSVLALLVVPGLVGKEHPLFESGSSNRALPHSYAGRPLMDAQVSTDTVASAMTSGKKRIWFWGNFIQKSEISSWTADHFAEEIYPYALHFRYHWWVPAGGWGVIQRGKLIGKITFLSFSLRSPTVTNCKDEHVSQE